MTQILIRGVAADTIPSLVMLFLLLGGASAETAEAKMAEFHSNAVNPGIKLRVTKSGLNYAKEVAMDILAKKVMSLKIPDQSGTKEFWFGDVTYELSDMSITHFEKPSTTVTVDPKTGLTWTLLNTQISINGRWRYKLHFIKDDGTFDVAISSRRFLTISAIFGHDASGHVTISSTGCVCNIDSMNFHLHGGASWLYSLLISDQVARPIQRYVQAQLCQIARKAIDVDARSRLATLPVAFTIRDRWVLDCRLVSHPIFQHGFLESFHKGEFFLKNDRTEAPFQAAPFPSSATDRMVNIWVSDYMLNSMSYVLFKNGILKHTLTKKDLPPEDQGVLNTTCTSLRCFGNLVPQAATAYPNASVEMEMAVSTYPIASMSKSGLNITGFGTVACRARLINGSLVPLFRANVSAAISLTASLNGDMILRGNITEITSVIHVTETQIGQISDEILTTVFNQIANTIAIPRLNVICQKGIPIPSIKDVRFVNIRMDNDDHCFHISTDVKYIASDETKVLRFLPND